MGVTVDRIRYRKWSGWIVAVGVLFLSLLPIITAQPGFLSIDCGRKTNRSGENNITWVSDANYIDVGKTAEIGDVYAYGSHLHNLRVFPKPLEKSCYHLPVLPNVPYLLRLWFAVGNYSGFKQLPSFAVSIETLGMLAMGDVTISDKDAVYNESILVSPGTVLYVCLIRTSDLHDPFISAIELRKLQQGMYAQAIPGTMLMSSWRYDAGGDSTIRYPEDKFDRIWDSQVHLTVTKYFSMRFVKCETPISTNNTKELPPPAVMQTAIVIPEHGLEIHVGSTLNHTFLVLLYFAEIEKLNMSQRRSFYVTINGENRSQVITSLSNYSTLEQTFISYPTDYEFTFALANTIDATIDPLINALEAYEIVRTLPNTYAQDLKALEAIKSRFGIKDWVSDPCFFIYWKGIVCHESSTSPIRILEIDLSGKNLTGPVPSDIGQLTALVKVSLNSNLLMGPLPNFSTLTMLETLYLQNNNLSGPLPHWLCELKSLKELNIENNNFSGVILAQLLNGSLKFSYCGNAYLPMHNGKCILHNKKKNKLKVLLPITLGGILIIALGLIVSIVVYRNKFRRKGQGVVYKRNYSKIMVPNSTKTRAFTLDEMIATTQTFSHEIGRGGFGSVFLGKLPQGKYIAVKVLSQFSQQGAQRGYQTCGSGVYRNIKGNWYRK